MRIFRDFVLYFLVGVLCMLLALFSFFSHFQTELWADLVLWVSGGGQLLLWLEQNLRLSIYPFFLCISVFVYLMHKLTVNLALENKDVPKLIALDQQVDLCIALFFGIGVIWTAIGMRSALILALGDLSASKAQELGAFFILQQLIDGGILLALTTTVVGGVGGYIMKMIKAWLFSSRFSVVLWQQQQLEQNQVEVLLSNILEALNPQFKPGSVNKEVS